MGGKLNPKIFGATLVGLALVAGAYTVSNFGESRLSSQNQLASAPQAKLAPRVPIAVVDNDENGIEDWRDTFVTTEITAVETASSTYVKPDTVTGNLGIAFIEGIISSRIYAPFSPSDEEVVKRTVNNLDEVSKIKLYSPKDISVIEEWSPEDIVNYANTIAGIIYEYSAENLDNELTILYELLQKDDPSRIKELETIREVYQNYRDYTLEIPVPALMAKEHLDLINTYQAIYEDLDGMTKAFSDPAVALIHIRRYNDDAKGLGMAFANIYTALERSEVQFKAEDPALLFVLFSPDYKP